jgi:hypothetical protein
MTSGNIASGKRWNVVGESACGESHLAAHLPNQDAIGWEWSNDARIVVLAVSDGHGSPTCFRSAVGSSLAVETALELLGGFGRGANGQQLAALTRIAADRLARSLTEDWNRRVDHHLRRHPFTKDEERYVDRASGSGTFASVAADPLLAYGATLVAVLLTPAFALYTQIGDGAILYIDDLGATRRVFAKDPSLAVNETQSLYQLDAWRELRLELMPLAESVPAIVAVTTDGYVNSFATDADFLQVGRDLREMIRAEGFDALARALPLIVSDAARLGSGDDVTLGIAKRIDGDEDEFKATVARRPRPAL